MHEVIDRVYIDEVVTKSVDIKCRPRKSRVDGRRFAA